VDSWGCARFAVIAYCFGKENGSEEEGEGFDSVVWLVVLECKVGEGRCPKHLRSPGDSHDCDKS